MSVASDPIVIVSAADAGYIRPLAVMLQSLRMRLSEGRRVALYIADGGIAEPDKERVAEPWIVAGSQVHWFRVPDTTFAGLPLWGRMSAAVYYKLWLANLLPASVRKALWLDADLLVLEDVARLWDLDLAGCHALAAQDSIVPLVSSRLGVAGYAALGLDPAAKYYNAGVLVADLERWRRDDVAGQVMAHLHRHRDAVYFWDQEALNVVLANNWGDLDPRWNHLVTYRDRAAGRGSAAAQCRGAAAAWILHFAGNHKPWVYRTSDRLSALYFEHLDLTPWAGWRPPRTVGAAMLDAYERSGLRGLLYPAEQWGVRLLRRVSGTRVVNAAPGDSPDLTDKANP
jgi:lipopolysaccharide biosynthesis glycosyltransferase